MVVMAMGPSTACAMMMVVGSKGPRPVDGEDISGGVNAIIVMAASIGVGSGGGSCKRRAFFVCGFGLATVERGIPTQNIIGAGRKGAGSRCGGSTRRNERSRSATSSCGGGRQLVASVLWRMLQKGG